MGDVKLRVNKARFGREEKVVEDRKKTGDGGKERECEEWCLFQERA